MPNLPDYGHRLRCPSCGVKTVDPTRDLLYCGSPQCVDEKTSNDDNANTMPMCFEPKYEGWSQADLILAAKINAPVILISIDAPPGHCCGLPPKGK